MKRAKKEGRKLIGISMLQTACWFQHVYKESGTTSLSDLTFFFDSKGVLAHWKNYSAGRSAPLEPVLKAVEKAMHHSMDYFTEGPERLPLWPVLEGDLTRAKLVLTRILGGFNMYSAKRTLTEKWQTLLDLLIAQRLKNDWRQHHQVLDDLVREDPNYLKKVLHEGEGRLEGKFMLAIVALAAQCLAMQDKNKGLMTAEQEQAMEFTYYFMEAIEGKPLDSAYNEEIANYIIEWYKKRADGQELDIEE